MINVSGDYKAAITADTRRCYLKAVVDIEDPDLVYGSAVGSQQSVISKPSQLHDKAMEIKSDYVTLEHNRWCLDGTFELVPEDRDIPGQIGFVGDALSGADGTFDTPQYAEQQFSGVSVLQAASVFFSPNEWDGVPADFTITVNQGGVTYHTATFTGNTATNVSITGLTVYNADAIRVTVTKWSLPGRRLRVAEIIAGIYETWDSDIVASFSLSNQGNFAGTALPYGTATLTMDNLDRRFEPRNKAGIFQMLEERQGIEFFIGVRLPDSSVEYVPCGVFYQYGDGWKTGNNDITMTWNLVDIVGLISSVRYIAPSPLPTTLGGWIQSIVAQLGTNYAGKYTVDAGYTSLPLTVRVADDVADITCGDLLRYACMATGTFPRADAETGNLTVEPLWSQGNEFTLDNINSYPVLTANPDIMAVIFELNDGNKTQYIVSGNQTASGKTESVNNPFIQNASTALLAARAIISQYGGNQIQIVGRGDPSNEIGDVPTVELDNSAATTGRLMYQTLEFRDGVLRDCQSTLLQADGGYLFQNREVITTDGTWTAPAGVSAIRFILVGGGSGGTDGTDGTWSRAGVDGVPGNGGAVYSATININPQQSFACHIGSGGTASGGVGGATTFGTYSSADGYIFTPSFTDVGSGDAYGRTGINAPLAHSGDGGAAGKGGVKGNRHEEEVKLNFGHSYNRTVIDNRPGDGTPGQAGASGVIIVWYDKEG